MFVVGPRFRTFPQNVQAEIGNDFTLYCESDGYPVPLIFWIHEDSNTIVHYGSNFTEKLTYHNNGQYTCQSQVQGYAPISAKANVYILGPPKITSKPIQYATTGDRVILECTAKSTPMVKKLYWTRFGNKHPKMSNLIDAYFKLQVNDVINKILSVR